MTVIENRKFDMERALYESRDLTVKNCSFDGPADGESALKECSDITVENCCFNLRYPLWHVNKLSVSDSKMTELCRAALWYSENIRIVNTEMFGIKALRECKNASLENCRISSPEFGWSVAGISAVDCNAVGEYFMMRSSDLYFRGVTLCGKYSFQYIKNGVFENCNFDTKDAFWHAENVTVRDSTLKGEYLAWYSENLTLERCKIIGTQPLCYCKGLKLVDCEMVDADLCFEKSSVDATLTSPVISIKNPLSGRIVVPDVGEIIKDYEDIAEIVVGKTAQSE